MAISRPPNVSRRRAGTTPGVGDFARVFDMPGRSGLIDRLSNAPGEPIARIEDHWYFADALIVEETE